MENSDNVGARSLQTYQDSSKELDLFEGRQLDLAGAASGYGSYCPEGIPIEQALCLLLAGFAVAFGILFQAVTKTTGKKRKKRFSDDSTVLGDIQEHTADMFWWGRSIKIIWLLNIFEHFCIALHLFNYNSGDLSFNLSNDIQNCMLA